MIHKQQRRTALALHLAKLGQVSCFTFPLYARVTVQYTAHAAPKQSMHSRAATYGSAMPEQLPGRREMVRLQQRRVILPELHYAADKG